MGLLALPGKYDVLMTFTDKTCIPNSVRLTTVVEKPRGGTRTERDRQTDRQTRMFIA